MEILFGGLAALGAGIGINASQSGAITSALKAGNYAAALTSLVDFSGSKCSDWWIINSDSVN